MRLSEAIRLGSLAIQEPKRGDIHSCAIGMACEAIGQRKSGDRNYSVLTEQWPWTAIRVSRRFNQWSYGSDGIWSLFDGCVAAREPTMTIEQLCDVVAEWEAEFAAKGINVEQVTLAAELTEPASPTQSIEKELELDCVATPRGGE